MSESTLEGRRTALRVAREELVHQRVGWTTEEARRFRALQAHGEDFTSRPILELMDSAC